MKRIYYDTSIELKTQLYGAIKVDDVLETNKTFETVMLYALAKGGFMDGNGISYFQFIEFKKAYNHAAQLLVTLIERTGENEENNV